ncbi:acetyl-CoA acetyltransferase [Mesorhizobium sp. A623]
MTPTERIPVIIGIGEVVDRPEVLANAVEPLELMAEALRAAERDAGGSWLSRLDSLVVINSVSWPYRNLPQLLAEKTGCKPQTCMQGPVGGETPVRFLSEAAAAIAGGDDIVAAIAGGEAAHSVARARKSGEPLPWTPPDPLWKNPRSREYLHPLACAHGVSEPVFVYPLYENATQAVWGQTPREARGESALLWSRNSEVAAQNEYSWLKGSRTASQIETASKENRLIAWPYPKLMTANPMVNQGGAVLVASLAAARAAGIPETQLVYFVSAAIATEPRDWLSRDTYIGSPAQDAVLASVLEEADVRARDLDAMELYSCFPCVPKMARRSLGTGPERAMTVAGGLTFFGAPLNTYMTHAAAAMVRQFRGRAGTGLLYGQGEFVTKHCALVLSGDPSRRRPTFALSSVQARADSARGAVPPIVTSASGPAAVETFTVLFTSGGDVEKGVVVLRLPGGARTVARVAPDDEASLSVLMALARSPVGHAGEIVTAADGLLEWRAGPMKEIAG